MLTKWFGTRSSRSLKEDRCFRPWLETLEERNAPSGPGGGPPGPPGPPPPPPHGPPPPPPHGPPPPPPGPVNNGVINNNNNSSNVNAHGSFNGSTISGSFNDTINNSITFLSPGQSSSLGGLFALGALLGIETGNSSVGSLIDDEVALAVDTYLSNQGLSSVVPTLSRDITTLDNAIAGLSSGLGPFGPIIGNLAYDVTYSGLTAGQPKI